MTREPTPFEELNQVLKELVDRVGAALGERFTAACLQGSFAVGDFDRHSDVDFIIVVDCELDADEVGELQHLHSQVYDLDSEWAKHLEGSYFPREILARCDQRGKLLWYVDHGHRALVQSTHCNTAVVRSVVREYGIRLAGPDPATLVDPVPVHVLRDEIAGTITNWGNEILRQPDAYSNRFYQSLIVLNYCRMLHDLQVGCVGSKRAGAEWAKTHLDPAWIGLIDRAWGGRPDPAVTVRTPADAAEFAMTLEFLRYTMQLSTAYMSGGINAGDES